jgi:prepilin peptidase CpaA
MWTQLPAPMQVVLVLIVVTAGIYDFRYRRIPNWLVLVGLVLGFALSTFLFELAGLERAGLGMGLALAIYFPLYLLRAMEPVMPSSWPPSGPSSGRLTGSCCSC